MPSQKNPIDRPDRGPNLRHPRSRIALLAPAAMAAAWVTPALAQQGPVALEPIVVEAGTLSGGAVDAAKLGSSATVITGKELELRQICHVADALRTVPGLAVSRAGSVGGLTQIRIRGD